MGRWSWSNKIEADGLKKVEIWWLQKYGYLNGWKSGSIEWKSGRDDSKSSIGILGSTNDGDSYVKFYYTQTDRDTNEKKDFDYKIQLTTTPCRYGRFRYWFICPLSRNGVYCGRRVGVLYKAGDYFGCRHCHDLTYSSRKENRRHKWYYLSRVWSDEEKIDKLKEKIKRRFYRGKPTKKFRRLLRISQASQPYLATLIKNNKKGIL